MKTIIFDKSCMGWMENMELNLAFVRHRTQYIVDRFKVRGYIYLNQIHEFLGIEWYPTDEDVCYTILDGVPKFQFETVGDEKILIHIS